ncbi:hypothetical protein B0H13DRAFT_1919775 [Mycena leptocephala]|nr:hypothetical protein B0H13DRAFT_1919775 [Mycena leptocephala]
MPPGNVLKLEMLLQNELYMWDEQVKEFGFLPPKPIVIAMESRVQIIYSHYVFSDAKVQNVFDSGKELGLQSGGICYLHLFRGRYREDRLRIRIRGIPRRRAKRLTIGIFRVPHILSPEQYTQEIHPMLDKFTAMPSTQKTYQKFDRLSIIIIRPSSELIGCGPWPVGAEYRHGRSHAGPRPPGARTRHSQTRGMCELGWRHRGTYISAFARCEITLTGACSSNKTQKLGRFCCQWARSRISPSIWEINVAIEHDKEPGRAVGRKTCPLNVEAAPTK